MRQAASAAETDLIATLRDADDWDRVAETETGLQAMPLGQPSDSLPRRQSRYACFSRGFWINLFQRLGSTESNVLIVVFERFN